MASRHELKRLYILQLHLVIAKSPPSHCHVLCFLLVLEANPFSRAGSCQLPPLAGMFTRVAFASKPNAGLQKFLLSFRNAFATKCKAWTKD